MGKLFDYFKNMNANDKLVQSYIIGNVSFEEIKDDLNLILSKFIFKKEVNIENNADIYILTNEEKNISKSEIKELITRLSQTSQFNNNKVYIIENFEQLNVNSNNALLKILEEPKEGIYAFLITKNINSVLPTINSRCQKIFISSGENETDNNIEDKLINEIVDSIEVDNLKTIAKKSELYSIINDRNQFIEILKKIFVIYEQTIKMKLKNSKYTNIIIENNDIKTISKKLIVINNTINRLNNNANKNLSIDRFIIEMCRCKI